MKQILVILDAGHGGMFGGKYTTAPAKMFTHIDGSIAMEGVINRQVKDKLIELLRAEGIAFEDITNTGLDTPLGSRTRMANQILSRRGSNYNCLYLSIHSNASPDHQGSGFEIWTSPGQTLSDKYAEIWAQEIKKEFTEFHFRSDFGDGDLDKEEKFYVLVHTAMPAVLGELLFFDNMSDWRVQRTPKYIDRIAHATLNFIKRAKTEVLT
jgi:N-acetylmuramoyl-L-alanine amidase